VGPGRQPQRRCAGGGKRLAAAWAGRLTGLYGAGQAGPRETGPRARAAACCAAGLRELSGLLLGLLARLGR
jgi:hypothetical protein